MLNLKNQFIQLLVRVLSKKKKEDRWQYSPSCEVSV